MSEAELILRPKPMTPRERARIVAAPAKRILMQLEGQPRVAAELMRDTARHLLEEAEGLDPFVPPPAPTPPVRRWPSLTDWIGGLCLMAITYLLVCLAGVLS